VGATLRRGQSEVIKWITILLAVIGLGLATYTIATARHDPPKAPLAAEPSVNPYAHGIAATGLVEAASRNIQVAAPEGGLVMRVHVQVGDRVKVGDPLFELDSRALQADLVRARAQVQAARAELQRLQATPRPEEIPPLEAAVRAAEAELADWTDQYERYQQAAQQVAGSDVEARRRWFAMEGARARLEQARATLALAKAGAWGAELEVARANIATAEAAVAGIQMLVERRTVRSPIDGSVLKRNIEPGQFTAAEARTAAMVVGDLGRLHVRAQVDEEDVPGLREGAAGTARVRGPRAITFSLRMLRIEPLASPKVELSGATNERVDTRVVEVLFEIEGETGASVYPGQLVDVFIDGAPPAATGAAASPDSP
jgi:HlyD family secretion protein